MISCCFSFRRKRVTFNLGGEPIDAKDDVFWDQFWSESVQNVQDVFTLIPAAEVRAVREESPPTLPLCATRLLKNL
ncbi:protein HID1-like isoform X2 [Tachypleus tridentatus]|uniref:protein HID1-like isoform X2 n=1 Tax=Tachypleus tridentatus TaxID=6853 RepID=UPI003FD14D36